MAILFTHDYASLFLFNGPRRTDPKPSAGHRGPYTRHNARINFPRVGCSGSAIGEDERIPEAPGYKPTRKPLSHDRKRQTQSGPLPINSSKHVHQIHPHPNPSTDLTPAPNRPSQGRRKSHRNKYTNHTSPYTNHHSKQPKSQNNNPRQPSKPQNNQPTRSPNKRNLPATDHPQPT